MLSFIALGFITILFLFVICLDVSTIKRLRKYYNRLKDHKRSEKKQKYISYELHKEHKQKLDFYISHTSEALDNLEIELTNELENDDRSSLINTIVSVGIPSVALLAAILSIIDNKLKPDILSEMINVLIIGTIILIGIYAIENLLRNIKLKMIKSHLTMVLHAKKIKNEKENKKRKK